MPRSKHKKVKSFYIACLYYINIVEDIGEGFEILPSLYVTNNKSVIGRYLVQSLKEHIGILEFDSIAEASVVVFSEEWARATSQPVSSLNSLNQLARLYVLSTWFIKDNSVNMELGFLHMPDLTGKPSATSNFLAAYNVNASGNLLSTQFTLEELSWLSRLWLDVLFAMLIEQTGATTFDRVVRALRNLDFARRSNDLGVKIAYYIICFETLFSVDTTELAHKVSERVAFFVGDTPERKLQIYRHLKTAYGIRSRIVHGDSTESITREKLLSSAVTCDAILRNVLTSILQNKATLELFSGKGNRLEEYLVELTFGMRTTALGSKVAETSGE